MPIIPTYSQREHYRAPQVAASSSAPRRINAARENDLQTVGKFIQTMLPQGEDRSSAPSKSGTLSPSPLRQELAETVHKNGADVSALDRFAAAHFLPDNTDETASARQDYLLLRAAAQEDAQALAAQTARSSALEELNRTQAVGSTAPDGSSLKAYLDGQLPAHQARLQAQGVHEQAVQTQLRQVRAATAATCMRRALSAGKLHAAQDFFATFRSDFSAPAEQAYRRELAVASARQTAQALWANSANETDGSVANRQAWAVEKLKALSAPLRRDVARQLAFLRRREETQAHAACAQVYERLASGEEMQDVGILAPSVLPAAEVSLAERAAQEKSLPAAAGAPQVFNRLYFSASQQDNARAFEKGDVSAREYLALEAARHRRGGGLSDRESALLCRGIEAWHQRKGISKDVAEESKRAVLSAAFTADGQASAWGRIKQLLDF